MVKPPAPTIFANGFLQQSSIAKTHPVAGGVPFKNTGLVFIINS